ncbi:hypothetical protein [Mycobacterium sp. ZZG]
MMAVLQHAVPIATLIFVVSSMLAMGLGLRITEITAPLRNARLVAMSLLANFLLMPAAAVLLAKVLALDEPFAVGLLLLGVAAGASFLPKLAQIAKGDLAFAVAVVVLLVVVNFRNVLSVFGTRAILAGLLFIAIGYALGWGLGGPAAATRPVLGLGTAQRNIAAALVVGGQSFNDPSVVVMVVVVAIVSLLVLLPLSRALARRTAAGDGAPRP